MRLLALSVMIFCASCTSTRISDEVLEVARSTTRAGEFHIEFGADGQVIEAAGAVPLDAVPAACRAAADAAHPGGKQTGAERVYADGATNWMVAKTIDGREIEVLVHDDGTIVGGEEVLAQSAWPAAVVNAAKAAVPGASLERVERVWGTEASGAESFHLKFDDHGESVRVGVSADAHVVRVVRRLSGQVRVPR